MKTPKIMLYEGQKHSVADIAKAIGASHYVLYKYTSGLTPIDKMGVGMVYKIAEFEKIGMKNLYLKMKEMQEKEN